MTYELIIDAGKEKTVINFLKQLDFVTVKAVKKDSKKKIEKKTEPLEDLPYFGLCPDWDMDVRGMRKKSTEKRLKGWL